MEDNQNTTPTDKEPAKNPQKSESEQTTKEPINNQKQTTPGNTPSADNNKQVNQPNLERLAENYQPNGLNNSDPTYNQNYGSYQYPNYQQPWGYQYGHGFGFPPHGGWGYQHGHRGHHGFHGHHRGYEGYRGHHGRGGYQRQNQYPREEYSNQYPPFYGFPPPPMYPPPADRQQMPPFAHSPPPPPPFGMMPPPFGYAHPPPPFNCPPMGEGQIGRSCHRGRGKHGWKHKGRKHRESSSSRSKSKSSSSSSSSSENSKYRLKSMKKEESIKYNQDITKFYQKEMNDFMESRQINEKQRQKIIKVLKKRFPAYDAPVMDLRKYLEIIEKQNLVFRMSYVKIIKVLLKYEFDLSQAIPKIQKIQYHKLKKYQADRQFNENYGQMQQTPLLQVNDLILMQSNNKKAIYLIDGNNILPTNKHFRKYFQSKKTIEKVFAQIRIRWYVSHCFQKNEAILFFDQKYEDKDNEFAKKYIFSNKTQQDRANQIEVIYGDGKKADDKIVEKLVELTSKDEKMQIILISADRDLNMRCQLIKPILHTSGRYFFKYCKYNINRKYKTDKKMKHLAKGIAVYDQYKY